MNVSVKKPFKRKAQASAYISTTLSFEVNCSYGCISMHEDIIGSESGTLFSSAVGPPSPKPVLPFYVHTFTPRPFPPIHSLAHSIRPQFCVCVY